MAAPKTPKLFAGERQFPVISVEPTFVVETAPPHIQYLAHQKHLHGIDNLTVNLSTVSYNANGFLSNTNLRLDLSDISAKHSGQTPYFGLYVNDGNFFARLHCLRSNYPINPDSILISNARAPVADVEVVAETRLPHQFFYSALLFTHQGAGTLYLIKHAIVYNNRSNMGEILQKMLKTTKPVKVTFGASILSEFIKHILTSPTDFQKKLHRFLASSADARKSEVDAVHYNYNEMYADFKRKYSLSNDATAFPAFVEHLSQWIYLH